MRGVSAPDSGGQGMGRILMVLTMILLAGLFVAAGAWLTYFGLGAGGEGTSRSWATLGPILAGLGVALVIVTFNRGKNR